MKLNKAGYLKVAVDLRDMYLKAIDGAELDTILMSPDERLSRIESHKERLETLKGMGREEAIQSIEVCYDLCSRQAQKIFGDNEEVTYDFSGVEDQKAAAH